LAKARKVGLLKDGYAGWLIQRDWEDKRFTVQGLESGLAKYKAKESEIGKLLKDPVKYRDHILAFWMDYAAELQKQVDTLLEIERQVKGRKNPEKKSRKAKKFNPFNVEMQELDVVNARIELQISYNNYINFPYLRSS
jgi:tRNA U34 5-carboxymethylaminomethyl modifying enzyme MnmG/GidA